MVRPPQLRGTPRADGPTPAANTSAGLTPQMALVKPDGTPTVFFFRWLLNSRAAAAAAGGNQTPWESDIDAAGFNLDNLGGVELDAGGITFPDGTTQTTAAGSTPGGITDVTASAPLASSGGSTPNITITSPLPVANGGSGSAAPSLVAGANVIVSGAWPNQTIAAAPGAAPVSSVFTRTGAVVAQPGDYTAAQVTNAVSTLGAYADPAWITSLSWNKITPVPFPIVSAYDFPAQSPGGSLAAGSNTITLAPVPPGVNAADTAHYLYISGGTGTAEAVLITGGTAVAGAASGTIVFTCANTHTGTWTITSASAGLQECLLANPASTVFAPAGVYNLYAKVTFPATTGGLAGAGRGGGGNGYGTTTFVVNFTAGDVFYTLNAINIGLSGFILYAPNPATSGNFIHLDVNTTIGGSRSISNIDIFNAYVGILFATVVNFSDITVYYHFGGIQAGFAYGGTPAAAGLTLSRALMVNMRTVATSIAGSFGVRILAQSGGTISDTFIGGAATYGLLIDPNAIPYPVNETSVCNLFIDGFVAFGLYVVNNPAGAGANHWAFSNLQINASMFNNAYAMSLAQNVRNWTFSSCRFGFGARGVVITGSQFITFSSCNIYPITGAGNSPLIAVDIGAGGSPHDLVFTGCNIGLGVDSAGTQPTYGLVNEEPTLAGLTVTGNTISGILPLTLLGSETGVLATGNNGVDNVIPSVASAATITAPLSPFAPTFKLTGVTAVTAINGFLAGRTIRILYPAGAGITVLGRAIAAGASLTLTSDGVSNTTWY